MKKVIGQRSTVQRSVATCNLAPALVFLATNNMELGTEFKKGR